MIVLKMDIIQIHNTIILKGKRNKAYIALL